MTPDFDLKAHNTFGLPAHARFGTEITHAAELAPLLADAKSKGLPLRILGGGSNVVLRPQFDGIIGLMGIEGRDIIGRQGDHNLVQFGAGENWHSIVEWTVAQGLPGLENLAAIPGTIGAAPIQNIGAYGVELVDRFDSLLAFDTEDRSIRRFTRDECAFSYRQSFFKRKPGRFIVTSVTLALPVDWQPNLNYPGLSHIPADADAATILHGVAEVRGRKLPDWRMTGNAGSFFHNPIVPVEVAERLQAEFPEAPRYPAGEGLAKLSAAWLIERAGFKGFRHGNAGVSPNHALVLVNNGGATQSEISELAAMIVEGVETRFGVRLVQEPELL
ncbi:MAG: UDP-N-acetylmuramate dehydrogenase [Candidatus Devosia phytovorans]|uniref:UDP-N-acetylenolpyruvoylglucosamine reductase n=1 Tax=Candidatus Devosia phytovorans TaxID=3121372 RepID=A0AAJ6B3K1_9HYPH|nr:UDP-N-acetylmuramate dehydrogenase [Devosia sp.]WEK06533.1 MAG: UDP-N-acetylmuramate dehydrogenase [Devosia sp.]